MAKRISGTGVFRSPIRMLLGFLVLTSVWIGAAGGARACYCEKISPAEGFERLTLCIYRQGRGNRDAHMDRPGGPGLEGKRETLTHRARLMDVYAKMDCESFFKEGERYLFFAIVAKGPRDIFYHPQVCNWTSPLHSKRVVTPDGASVWLEDLIIREQARVNRRGRKWVRRLP